MLEIDTAAPDTVAQTVCLDVAFNNKIEEKATKDMLTNRAYQPVRSSAPHQARGWPAKNK